MATKIESLEARRLLALATWDGGGDNQTWTQAANWAGDVLPTPDDDVVIPAASHTPPRITLPQIAHFQSLMLSRSVLMPYGFPGTALTIDNELRITSGGSLTPAGMIDGTGVMVVETGGSCAVEPTFFGNSTGMSLRLPTVNHGIVATDGGLLGPHFQNFGQLRLGPSSAFGTIINESSGSITSFYFGMNPSSGSARLGVDLDANNVVVPAPFINRGSVYAAPSESWTGLTYETSFPSGTSITICLDATSSLGGSWRGSRAGITFTRLDASPDDPVIEFDSTFNFTNGTLTLNNLDTRVRGMGPETGLKLIGNSHVTLIEPVTRLALLKVAEASTLTLAEGSRVLHVNDIETSNSPDAFNLTDGLLIHGNQPGYGRPWIQATTPATTPAYADFTRGTINGNSVTIEPNGSRYGVGYTIGAGLASHYPSHTFRGETFDDDDFVFFTTLRGDTNFDRQVNFDDLLVVAKRYRLPTSRGYADGNFSGSITGNGTIDFDDLLALAQNYGLSAVRQSPTKRGGTWSHDVIA